MILKKRFFYLVSFILILIFTFCVFFFSPFLIVHMEHNGKIAVMVDSKWKYINGWPQTDYLSIIRETVSALNYLGYRFDLVNEKISMKDLNRYEMLISVSGVQGKKVIQYSKATGRTTFILYDISPELYKFLGITRGEFILKAGEVPRVVGDDSLISDIISKYGTIPIWGAYNHNFNRNAKVLLESMEGLPILVDQKESYGRYIFLLTRALTWNAYNYKLLDNVIRDSTNLSRVGGVPYAMDVPVIVRLDDFSTWMDYWDKYSDITKKLTVAGIMNKVDEKSMSVIAGMDLEIIPHGYEHKDLSQLAYEEQIEIISKAMQKYIYFIGSKPQGYVSPYNRINDVTTKACSALGLKWITTYHGMAKIPRYYYTDSPNRVWVLGARPESFTDTWALEKALEEGAAERKPLMFVERPYARKKEDILNNSLSSLQNIVIFAGTREGFYLTGLGEYFRQLEEQRLIYRNDDKLIVEEDVSSGLTFTYPECGSDNMMKVGNSVLIFYRNGSTVLPALKKGYYPLKPVKNMPIIREPGPGIVVKSAVYNPDQNIVEIMLEAFIEKEIQITVDNMPEGSYVVEILQSDENKKVQTVALSDVGLLKIPIGLLQDTETNIKIVAKAQ